MHILYAVAHYFTRVIHTSTVPFHNRLLMVWRKHITIVALVVLCLSFNLAHRKQFMVRVPKIKTGSVKTYLVSYFTIKRVLTKANAPLASEAHNFASSCIRYQLNCYLLPAISGVESGFGKAMLEGSHNAWGWGGGYLYYPSWSYSIDVVAKGVKQGYINKGLTTPELMSSVYAPPSKTWGGNVRYFLTRFETEEIETKRHIALMEHALVL